MNTKAEVFYPNLEAMIAKRGVRKNKIAEELGVSPRTLTNKLSGKVNFTWTEVIKLQMVFFPDVSKEFLFETNMGKTY